MTKNLDTVFPFYDALTEQYKSRSDALTYKPYVITPNTKLPNFIIRRSHNDGTTADIVLKVVPVHGGSSVNLDAADLLAITAGTSYDHIYYTGHTLDTVLAPDDGGYYIDLEDEGVTPHKHYYSEIFASHTSVSSMIQMTFKSDTELNGIGAGFYQNLYINSILKYPEYIREDTGEKRDGIVVKEKQVMMKADILHILTAPEFLVDGLMLLPMMDEVNVYLQGGACVQPMEVKIDEPQPADELKGSVAKLKLSFINSVVIKKLNFKEMGCNCSSADSGSTRTQSKGAVLTAGVSLDLTWDTAYSTNTYNYIVQAWDDDFNPIQLTIAAQATSYLRVQSMVSGYVQAIANGTI
jgi:hypothetical protein